MGQAIAIGLTSGSTIAKYEENSAFTFCTPTISLHTASSFENDHFNPL